jgi:MFS family permease
VPTSVVNELSPSQRLTLLLDESPLKGIQLWLGVLSTGGTLLDGFVLFALGVAVPLIVPEFHIAPEVVGLIGSALVMGAVLGAAIGGRFADYLGRKRLMLADMMIIVIGSGHQCNGEWAAHAVYRPAYCGSWSGRRFSGQ